MNKFVFVVSHLGSDYLKLVDVLNSNPQIQIQNTNFIYFNPISLEPILRSEHKLLNSSAIYGDCLLKNFNLQTKSLYSLCKFIYFISPAKYSINRIMSELGVQPLFASRYYCYRLRRIYEMVRENSGVFVNTQKFQDSLNEIKNYLDLTEELNGNFEESPFEDIAPFEVVKYCEERYEYYLYKIKSLIH